MESSKDANILEGYENWISEFCGQMIDPGKARTLFPQIQKHKWLLSEKLNRDVGYKVATIDYLENADKIDHQPEEIQDLQLIKGMEARRIDPSVWETISESQPPKQIVNKRIILPLTQTRLARKHAVMPPRTIIFFGPPGTGKTHFVQAIAGILRWWFIEVSPSTLMADGEDRMGANLKSVMDKARNLNEAILFIDEFEEIAANRDNASRIDKSITNEFLKQVPLLKAQPSQNLLVCATNYIRQLDAALLRPGRFDCIIPVGVLDDESRRRIVEHYLTDTNRSHVDVEQIIARIPLFTPADIEFLFQKVRQAAFEKECFQGDDFRVTTTMILEMIPSIRPTLTEEAIEAFNQDCDEFTRY
jgi:transitional endoplasmic reticulum ATPase